MPLVDAGTIVVNITKTVPDVDMDVRPPVVVKTDAEVAAVLATKYSGLTGSVIQHDDVCCYIVSSSPIDPWPSRRPLWIAKDLAENLLVYAYERST